MGDRPPHPSGAEHPTPGLTEIMDVILDRYPEMVLQHLHQDAQHRTEAVAAEEN